MFGLDAGNESAGLSAYTRGTLIHHQTVKIWSAAPVLSPIPLEVLDVDEIRLVCEGPLFGRRKTNCGIHWAGGELTCRVKAWLESHGRRLHKRHVTKPTVSQWRSRLGLKSKEEVLVWAEPRALYEAKSEDELESIAIGYSELIALGVVDGRQ